MFETPQGVSQHGMQQQQTITQQQFTGHKGMNKGSKAGLMGEGDTLKDLRLGNQHIPLPNMQHLADKNEEFLQMMETSGHWGKEAAENMRQKMHDLNAQGLKNLERNLGAEASLLGMTIAKDTGMGFESAESMAALSMEVDNGREKRTAEQASLSPKGRDDLSPTNSPTGAAEKRADSPSQQKDKAISEPQDSGSKSAVT